MAAKRKEVQPKSKKQKIPVQKPNKVSDFELAWNEYNAAISKWKESLALWQKATSQVLARYHDACQEALGTDAELLKKVSSTWEQAWQEIGPEYIKQQQHMLDNIFRETNLKNVKKFNEEWERFLKTSGEESVKAYQEAIKKFNDAWPRGQAVSLPLFLTCLSKT